MAFQTFQFQPSSQNEYPLHDMIGKLLGGYSQASQARFLQPNLREDLLKKQQYNQYYGPDMQSQIGLRNSQRKNVDIRNQYLPQSLQEALIKDRLYNKNYQSNNDLEQALKAANIGNISAMTNEKNLRNKYLEPSLQEQLALLRANVQDKEGFNQFLQQHLGGGQGQGGEQAPMQGNENANTYVPNQGMPPFAQSDESGMQQSAQQNQSPIQAPMQQSGAPQLTAEDIQNKHYLGIDTFGPKYKAWVDTQAKGMEKKQAEAFKNDAKKEYKTYEKVEALNQDIPVIENTLQKAVELRDIIRQNPSFYGHITPIGLGKFYNAAERFAKTSNNPLVGTIQTEMLPLIANAEGKLSERGNQLALKIGAGKLPQFDDSPQVALGKMNAIIDSYQKQRDLSTNNLNRLQGKLGQEQKTTSKSGSIVKAMDKKSNNERYIVRYNGVEHLVPADKIEMFKGKKGVTIERAK
jgi:hypothetical protein